MIYPAAVYIDKEHISAYRVYNFHYAYVYTVHAALACGFPVPVYSNDPEVCKTLARYAVKAELIGSKKELTQVELFFDPAFPLVKTETFTKLVEGHKKKLRFDLPFVQYLKNDGMLQMLPVQKEELLVAGNIIDDLFIESYIKSELNTVHPVKLSGEYKIDRRPAGGKPKLLFSAPYEFFSPALKQKIESGYDVTYAFNAPYDVTAQLLDDREIWITGTCPPYYIDKQLMSRGKKLKIVATPSTGTNHIDVAAATGLGLKVCSIKTAEFLNHIHASSEHTFTLLLAMIKKIPFVTESARFGTWREEEHIFRSIELHGKTIGIIGYGRIGRNLARYCYTFGMQVLAFDPEKKITDDFTRQVQTRKELLEESDIVSVNYHLTPHNHKSFGQADFDLMKTGSYFLNTARGELVDEEVMLRMLDSGKLKAAAVDVISNEAGSDKWNHPVIAYARKNRNLIVSPHTAGLTVDSESKAAIEILKEIDRVWEP